MQQLEQHINEQIKLNAGKNIFAKTDGLFRLMPIPYLIKQEIETITKDEQNCLIDYITNKSLEAFYRLNQYYYFSIHDKKELRSVYAKLLQNLKLNNNIDELEKLHYQNLRNWLLVTNPFSRKIYSNKNEILQDVVCEEYNAQVQMNLLHIDLKLIKEPVLDIGCGKNGNLVKNLRKSGIEAYGFDRMCCNTEFCLNTDWFSYEFGKEKWGTIISNLGFSNHFNHHHLRSDGDFKKYAQTYMQILHSLKHEGTFHYAPELPFIEKYLTETSFEVYSFPIASSQNKATIVRKLNYGKHN